MVKRRVRCDNTEMNHRCPGKSGSWRKVFLLQASDLLLFQESLERRRTPETVSLLLNGQDELEQPISQNKGGILNTITFIRALPFHIFHVGCVFYLLGHSTKLGNLENTCEVGEDGETRSDMYISGVFQDLGQNVELCFTAWIWNIANAMK